MSEPKFTELETGEQFELMKRRLLQVKELAGSEAARGIVQQVTGGPNAMLSEIAPEHYRAIHAAATATLTAINWFTSGMGRTEPTPPAAPQKPEATDGLLGLRDMIIAAIGKPAEDDPLEDPAMQRALIGAGFDMMLGLQRAFLSLERIADAQEERNDILRRDVAASQHFEEAHKHLDKAHEHLRGEGTDPA